MNDKQKLADRRNVTLDPLSEHEDIFEDVDAFFNIYWEDVIETKDITDRTKEVYRRNMGRWIRYMNEEGRHPALPSLEHAKEFIRHLRDEEGLKTTTIKGILNHVIGAFDYFAQSELFPHAPDSNIVRHARDQIPLGSDTEKEYRNLSKNEVATLVQSVNHIRDRLIVLIQLKLGLRAGEVANIQLRDFHLKDEEIRSHFPTLGEHPRLGDHEQAIFIPSTREGNKSKNDRILPLDEEVRGALTRYLAVRPDNGEQDLILGLTNNEPIEYNTVNDAWKKHGITERYPETEEFRPITSHYGRHFFTNFWLVEQDWNRHLVQYMRGDILTGKDDTKEGIDHYLHPTYEDIETPYREQVYNLL